MVRFFNQDEMGIEGISDAAGRVVKPVIKTASDQTAADKLTQDIVNQLYGVTDASQEGQDQNGDKGIEGMGQAQKGNKAMTNVRNPAAQQAAARRTQMLKAGKKPEEIEKLEKLRKLLHDEQVKDLFEPKKQKEESVAEKQVQEEEEKKKKKQEKQVEEQKKKEDLAVVQKRTAAERRPGAG